ncbi:MULTISPECIES: glycosyltransferase [unclassified Mycobacterium]|uniref:glycosyltransferase n=1 Tax=unclassified Mycobacterium TaxID=2642494 RepID=UPI00073FC124|nr:MULTISPECIES: glycosyltransferase [unclassified Mycobacterium]KUH80890.1 glycosyl transferase family 1 [Mycobacterium sp. GA-0227b]KUH92317.1 glycosyl transferase family 1 [Mycobacterium sp. GA-1999]
MRFVLACYGTRGDIEPGIVLGRELQRRGHEVQMAVAPDMVAGVEAAGLAAVGYGLNTQAEIDSHRDFWTSLFRNFWKVREVTKLWREVWDRGIRSGEEMSTTLVSLTEGADLLLSGISFQEGAANIAEYYGIPLATLHTFPMRAHGYLLPFLPAWVGRSAMSAFWWLHWRMTKKLDDAQRRELGLPRATAPSWRRIAERGSLEIQAYDEICFPGLAAEWSEFDGHRPFVGALTMESPTGADDEVASWIAAGTPPILFGFGSIPVASPADTLTMISEACTQLGERALVCSAWSDFSDIPHFDHVKVVEGVDFEAIFPVCRAVVHHGGAGTTAVSLRAGVPTLILWTWPDQSLRGGAIKRLKVGTARRFSSTNLETLIDDLRAILAPEYRARAREVAPQITKPAESTAVAADLVENYANSGSAG